MGKQPVIILGMHRSGTTMITRILEKLGLFVGWKKDENNEALFFQEFNNWTLRQVNAFWDNPYSFKFITKAFKNKMVEIAELQLKWIRRYKFLGPKMFFKYKDIRNLDIPWGWKDPRNTLTMDIWKEIFPNARLIHIYRNPVDVAESLYLFYINSLDRARKSIFFEKKGKLKPYLLKGHMGIDYDDRMLMLYKGVELWKLYIENAFSLEKECNILHIQYEDFLSNPLEILKKILEFVELDFDCKKSKEAICSVDISRKYSFLHDKELVQFYNIIKSDSTVEKFGYSNLL